MAVEKTTRTLEEVIQYVESQQLTPAQIEAKFNEATKQGFGLYMVKGRPNTLDVAPGAVVGELAIIDPSGR